MTCSGRLSVRDSGYIGRIGGSVGLTVRSFARLGSELTVRSEVACGSAFSVAGTTRIDQWLSIKENKTDMASSISVPGNIDLGNSISLMSCN